MLGFATRLLGGAIAPLVDQISAFSARLLRKLALFLVAGACLVVVLIALTVAFLLWIATLAGPIVAALAVAGVYLAVAVVAIILALRDKPTRSSTDAAEGETDADVKERSTSALNAQIDQFTAPLMALFARFGFRREQFAVLAGASVAKQLGPLSLVGLAIVGGFLIGRMWKSWRTLLSADVIARLLSSGLFGFGSDKHGEAEDA